MQFQSRDAIDIDTSPERAWATMVDVEGWPRWTPKTRRYLRQEAEGLRAWCEGLPPARGA